MKKKILITGGHGYLGPVIAPYLVSIGYEVVVYDTGYFEEAKFFPIDNSYRIVKGDMKSFEDNMLNDVFAVVHLSGISNDPLKGLDIETFYDPTRVYTLDLANKCKAKGIKFIFASSCSIYGKADVRFPVTEESDVNPQTPYSVNKMQIEEDLTTISNEDFAPILLRFSTVFGYSPKIRFDLIVNMFAGMAFVNGEILLNSDGKAWRPLVSIKDIARSVGLSIEYMHKGPKPLVLNVGFNDHNFTVLEIVEAVKKVIPNTKVGFLNSANVEDDLKEIIQDRKLNDGVDSRTYRVNFDKIDNVYPEFKVGRTTLEEGIKELYEMYQMKEMDLLEFKRTPYYRLQMMEKLLNTSKIDKNLNWI
jgi:nucleoside-diphosphate-sugar epimerase